MWDKNRTFCLAYECNNFTCSMHANKAEYVKKEFKKENKSELSVIWVNLSQECGEYMKPQ